MREHARPRPRKVVLILSHMRSGSSLLLHLLLQHPTVAGAGERNQPIREPRDLDRLAADAYIAQRRWVRRADIFVDQINHDRFLDRPAILEHPDVRTIVLFRRPEPSLASMVAVLGRHYEFDRAAAEAYYLERLDGLTRLVSALPLGSAIALGYEALVDDTKPALRCLERYLDLEPPGLESRYPTHRFTGGAGDPSDVIRQGRVLARSPRTLEIEAATGTRVARAYTRLRDILEERFEVVA